MSVVGRCCVHSRCLQLPDLANFALSQLDVAAALARCPLRQAEAAPEAEHYARAHRSSRASVESTHGVLENHMQWATGLVLGVLQQCVFQIEIQIIATRAEPLAFLAPRGVAPALILRSLCFFHPLAG